MIDWGSFHPKWVPATGLTQHPDEHRPKGPVLLAVDQQLGEGRDSRVAPELSDPVGAQSPAA